MTEPYVGYSKNQIAQAVLDTELETTPPNAVVIDAVEKFCPPLDHRGDCTTSSSSSAKAGVADTSCGRSTPPTKTTRAKHTRTTTPTSPSWRFTNKPSRHVLKRVTDGRGRRGSG